MRHLGTLQTVTLLALAIAICVFAVKESSRSEAWSRVVRDWLTMGLILAGYWSIGWFAAPPITAWQEQWLGWDRILLDTWGMRALIESAGLLLPSLLETSYLLLYAVPPLCMCAVYWVGGRDRVHAFLFTLMLGTFAAYALLPLLPVHGPQLRSRVWICQTSMGFRELGTSGFWTIWTSGPASFRAGMWQ